MRLANTSPSVRSSVPGDREVDTLLSTARPLPVAKRGLTAGTCQRFQYLSRQNTRSEWEQLAVYRNSLGQPVFIKVRNIGTDGRGKAFRTVGSPDGIELFGQHLCGSGRKLLIITEGEIDCMSVSQVFDHQYAVVSISHGAAEAHKAIAKHLQWINTFSKVILAFDMDEPGRAAVRKCAPLLPPGRAYVAIFADKDANALLAAGREREVIDAINNAQQFRPDGILDARTLTERCLNPVITGLPWPWPFLTEWTYGRRPGEVYVWGGGTGIGKTDFAAEVIASTITGYVYGGPAYEPEAFAAFSYECGPAQLKKAIAGKIAKRRFHIPNANPDYPKWTREELAAVMRDMDQTYWGHGGRLYLNDSHGACSWDTVTDRLRFLAHAEGIRHALIDPVSALVAQEDDERKALDRIFLEAENLVEELQISLYFASHLARPGDGKSHEEGGHVSLKHFRGSNGIVMFTDFAFGLERNQQAEDPSERVKTTFRGLKDRYTGESVGKTQETVYDPETGTLDVPWSAEGAINDAG